MNWILSAPHKPIRKKDKLRISNKNSLAVSYINLGLIYEEEKNLTQAVEYYKQATEFWSQPVQSFPRYVEFKKNLSWVPRP